MDYSVVVAIHLVAATIWTGGHIVLACCILPRVLKFKDANLLLQFEGAYEKIGMPAIIIQVVTGLYLAKVRLPEVSAWFSSDNPVAFGIQIKLALLALTVVFALDARLRVIPRLSSANLVDMSIHIIFVTVFSVLFVLTGLSFRTGWLY